MKVLITSPGFPPAYRGGGPIRTLAAMLDSAPSWHTVYVVTHNHDMGHGEPLVKHNTEWAVRHGARVLYLSTGIRAVMRGLRRATATEPDVAYVNGLFAAEFSLPLAVWARVRRDVQLVIAPRGELDPGALALKARKKSLFLSALRMTRLVRSAWWHASTETEALHIRRAMGQDAVVVVREDDHALPRTASLPSTPAAPDEVMAGPRPLKAVFMSRVSPKKGLHIALEALSDVKSAVHLTVIGPEDDARYAARCRASAEAAPSHVRVDFDGAVPHEQIRRRLAEFDVMVLPTAGENFGHVIAEALSVGCPVMCTDTTPWTDVLRAGGGVVVPDREATSWATAVDDYAATASSEREQRRQNAARAYDAWRMRDRQPHLFTLLEERLRERGPLTRPAATPASSPQSP